MKKIFDYKKVKYRYIVKWFNKWKVGFFIKKSTILIHEGSCCINYSQQAFEGIRCFLNKKIINFRINLNSYRFQKSCNFLLIPIFNIFFFIILIKILSYLNYKYIPNKKIGFLYIRPLLLGIGKNIGVKTSKNFLFTIFCIPSFLKNKKIIIKSIFSKRVIKNKGHFKIGGNYITNIYNNYYYKKYNFDDYVHINNNYFEEIGTSNIILYKKNFFSSPINKNILPGINKISFLYFLNLNKNILYINNFKNISNLKNVISCGTAASCKIINTILYKNKIICYRKNFIFFYLNFFLKKVFEYFYKIKKWLY